MINKYFSRLLIYPALLFFVFLVIASCSAIKTAPTGEGFYSGKTDEPLDKKYRKIIVHKFEIDQLLGQDFPDAASACESSAMTELLRKSSVSRIEKSRSSASHDSGALLVKTRITALRVAGSASNRSEMAADLKLIDAASGYVAREKKLSTINSPSSSRTGDASDRALSSDLGKMIADYLAKVVQGE